MKEDLKTLVAAYRDNARIHGKATIEGDPQTANASYERIMEALREIRKFGVEGNRALLELIDDEDNSVRVWAASHSLRVNREKSEKVLLEISKLKGLIAFDAQMVLREWRRGTLRTP